MPAQLDGVKCVKVNARIYGHEPLAYRFLRKFAADNDLVVVEIDTESAEAAKSTPASDSSQKSELETKN